jgi:hypothetical protein
LLRPGRYERDRAGAYKAWAADGGERPALEVPPELAERQRARGVAAEELAAARVAYDTLSAERAAAVAAHGRACDAVFYAAKQLLVEEAQRIAAELEEALCQAFALNDDLHALAMLSAGTRADLAGGPAAAAARGADVCWPATAEGSEVLQGPTE